MISDGFTIPVTLSDDEWLARPLVSSQRRQLFERLKAAASEDRRDIGEEVIQQQVMDESAPPMDEPEFIGCFTAIVETDEQEEEDVRGLRQIYRLQRYHPEVANRSCESCRYWWYNHETGRVQKSRLGQPMKRPPGTLPPCKVVTLGCPKGAYDDPVVVSDRVQQAFDHWVEWRAVGCPHPEDAIMRRNWRVLNEEHERWLKRRP